MRPFMDWLMGRRREPPLVPDLKAISRAIAAERQQTQSKVEKLSAEVSKSATALARTSAMLDEMVHRIRRTERSA